MEPFPLLEILEDVQFLVLLNMKLITIRNMYCTSKKVQSIISSQNFLNDQAKKLSLTNTPVSFEDLLYLFFTRNSVDEKFLPLIPDQLLYRERKRINISYLKEHFPSYIYYNIIPKFLENSNRCTKHYSVDCLFCMSTSESERIELKKSIKASYPSRSITNRILVYLKIKSVKPRVILSYISQISAEERKIVLYEIFRLNQVTLLEDLISAFVITPRDVLKGTSCSLEMFVLIHSLCEDSVYFDDLLDRAIRKENLEVTMFLLEQNPTKRTIATSLLEALNRDWPELITSVREKGYEVDLESLQTVPLDKQLHSKMYLEKYCTSLCVSYN